MKTFSVVLAAMLGGTLASAAYSMPPELQFRHKEIHFADLNLNHSAGARRLYQRIRVAAKQLCGEPNPLVPARFDHTRRCMDEATTRAVEEVNSPLLTRYHTSM